MTVKLVLPRSAPPRTFIMAGSRPAASLAGCGQAACGRGPPSAWCGLAGQSAGHLPVDQSCHQSLLPVNTTTHRNIVSLNTLCHEATYLCTPNTLYTNTVYKHCILYTAYYILYTAYKHCTQTHCIHVYKWTLYHTFRAVFHLDTCIHAGTVWRAGASSPHD